MKGWVKKQCSDCGEKTMVPSKGGYRCTLCGVFEDTGRSNKLKKGGNRFGNVKSEYMTGEKFDSNLEKYLFDTLTERDISFVFKPEYVLVPSVKKDPSVMLLRNTGISKMKITPDFEMERKGVLYIVDAKGHCTETAKLRFRMLKYWFYLQDKADCTRILFLSNKEDIAKFALLYSQGKDIPDIWNFDYRKGKVRTKKKSSRLAKKGPTPELLHRKNKYERRDE